MHVGPVITCQCHMIHSSRQQRLLAPSLLVLVSAIPHSATFPAPITRPSWLSSLQQQNYISTRSQPLGNDSAAALCITLHSGTAVEPSTDNTLFAVIKGSVKKDLCFTEGWKNRRDKGDNFPYDENYRRVKKKKIRKKSCSQEPRDKRYRYRHERNDRNI